ncbi:nose resistant to fluoxetine protein 6-like [Episyrphus balteatus]|uniref:nose resistant to fluoxetine protein 6-like n=1 Tax=Episyrphus balteatus TaxID=286459 RepID=UPI002486C67A|nr:nose resistant to fluoxetine protein 6-like [Episyrphus balteatus]
MSSVALKKRKDQGFDQYLENSSILLGLSKLANQSSVNEECFKNLKIIENGITNKESWAMKVLDSSGKVESGFIWGHNYWLGSKQGCAATQEPVGLTLSKQLERTMKKDLISQMAPFKMDYRVVYMSHNSPWQVEVLVMKERIIHIGLCLPSACTSSEIKKLTQTVCGLNKFQGIKILELQPKVLYIKDLKLKDNFFEQTSLKVTIFFVVFTLVMTVLAWFFSTDDGTKSMKIPRIFSVFIPFIKCFDLMKNARELFTLSDSSMNSIPVINGLRTVFCFWILMGHVLYYMNFTVNNKTFMMSHMEKGSSKFITIMTMLVDVFFIISGFLQTYNFLRNEKKLNDIRKSSFRKNTKAFVKLVFHRYLRLAPLEFALIAIVALFTSYIEDVSVFHIYDRFDQTCPNYWWRNVLFIQNVFDSSELCLNWTWSLACEMQFFCLISVLLFVYAKHPNLVKNLVVTGLISSIFWTFIIGLQSQHKLSFDVEIHTLNEIYTNSFVRIVPYIVGSIGGWFLAQRKGSLKISSTMEKLIWNMTILMFFACIYSNFKRGHLSSFSSMTLIVGARLSISLIICWTIVASATGRGTWWSRILEWKIFQHTSRLSYAIYLMNPFVITIVFSLSESSIYFDPYQMIILCSGFSIIVYLISIIFSLAFEIPYSNWSRWLLRRNLRTDYKDKSIFKE